MLEQLRLVPHQSGSDKPNKVKWERPSVYSPEGSCGHNLSDGVLAHVDWKLCNPRWLIAEWSGPLAFSPEFRECEG
jgi:hypothetical protein